MGQRPHHNQGKRQKGRNAAHPSTATRAPLATITPKIAVVYGKPFVLLEDDAKRTFVYSAGQWVPHSKSIAECRVDCQIKQLAQKINGMTRYEVCSPLPAAN